MKTEKQQERYIKIGDDGALLAGDATEWVAVLDTRTNLMWAVKVLPRQTWKKALKAPEKLATAGFKDWRLPTVEELFYLADRTRSNPAIDKDFFPDTPSSWFWSSTPYSASPSGYAWDVHFSGGALNYDGQNYELYVRAVRSGQ